MRRVLLSIAIFLGLASVACAQVDSADAMNNTVKIAYGQSVTVPGSDLTLIFEELDSDSRCPEGVQCIRAGDVSVKIRAIAAGQSCSTYTLKLPGREHAHYQGYDIELLEVSPKPTKAQPQPPAENYSIVLSVKK